MADARISEDPFELVVNVVAGKERPAGIGQLWGERSRHEKKPRSHGTLWTFQPPPGGLLGPCLSPQTGESASADPSTSPAKMQPADHMSMDVE